MCVLADIAELKEMGLLEVGYADGKSSIFKALTPANLAPLEKASNPRKVCTPAKSAPLQNLHPTPANLAPPTPYISKDKILDYSPPPPPACARERLQKWFAESDLKTWVKMQLTRNDCTDLDTTRNSLNLHKIIEFICLFRYFAVSLPSETE